MMKLKMHFVFLFKVNAFIEFIENIRHSLNRTGRKDLKVFSSEPAARTAADAPSPALIWR